MAGNVVTPEQRPEVAQVAREFMLSNWPSWDASCGNVQKALEKLIYSHRIAAEKAAIERAAQIADADADEREGSLQSLAARRIAAAIRALAPHPERRSENG